jgi:hypothetical protein
VKQDKSALPTSALKRKAHRVLILSDEEDLKQPTSPPRKKQATASTSTTSRAQAQVSPRKKKSKRKKEESDYEDSSAEDAKEDSEPDFMDVDIDEVEETKKTPTKPKASTKRANVAASSGATRAERKSKATPAKIDSEEHEGGKTTPKFKCATFRCARH